MATAISFSTAKSMTISILQASRLLTWPTTTDFSNFQFPSDAEIYSAILTSDGIVCNQIINSLNHPYLSTFAQTSGALTNGANLPARNGVLIKITCLNGLDNYTFVAADVNTTANTINILDTQDVLTLGRRVQFSNSGGALPAGLSASTDYYVSTPDPNTDGYRFSISYDNALAGTIVDITTTGTGTQTMILNLYEPAKQGMSADEMTEVQQNQSVFGRAWRWVSGWAGVSGDVLYTSSQAAKVTYADYTLSSSPQAPEPYLMAVVAGAVADLAKDGFDEQVCSYYQGMFQQYLGLASQGAQVLPELAPFNGT